MASPASDRRIAPDRASACAALVAGRPQLLWTRIVADTETPVSAMLKLGREGSGAFLLESVEGGSVRARYSLLGLDPDLVWRARGDKSEINRNWRQDQTAFEPVAGDTLTALRALVAEARADVPAELPAALACLVGYMGYETVRLVEPSVPDAGPSALGLPDMVFVRPTLLLVFDRLKDELFIVAPIFAAADPGAAWDAAAECIAETERRLAQALPLAPRPPETLPEANPRHHTDKGRYAAMVEKARDYILAGDIFQVVLSQRFSVDFPLPAFDLYRALRRINPSPFL